MMAVGPLSVPSDSKELFGQFLIDHQRPGMVVIRVNHHFTGIRRYDDTMAVYHHGLGIITTI